MQTLPVHGVARLLHNGAYSVKLLARHLVCDSLQTLFEERSESKHLLHVWICR